MKLLLIGFGFVGQGLAELLVEKKEDLAKRHGLCCTVVGIADMLKGSCYNSNGIDLEAALAAAENGASLSTLPGGCDWNALEMIERSTADVMCEITYTDLSTGQPATDHIRAALDKGMSVTTTNKGPVALASRELTELAAANGLRFLFEGTVMAGTPLLNLLRETLAGSEIREMKGILNGSTNFILNRMEGGMDYEEALAEATRLGFAEAVPDADVLGHDALAKVTILANTVFGASLTPDDSPCEGITGITSEMIETAAAEGKKYKLIGRVRLDETGVHASVGPQVVDLSHPLAGVGGATNAMTVSTDTLGDVTIVGPGAGRRETGFSLLNDLIHIARA